MNNQSQDIPDESASKIFASEKNPSNIVPAKLSLHSKIKFRCHPGVTCFTACCGNINIILTPYDILRLRKYLNMDADEFLLRFTTPVYLEQTDLPGVKIHLSEDGRCPFVTPEGCTIYPARPTTCRYYPVGMANFHEGAKENEPEEKFFFLVKEPHCKGHNEDKEWTVAEWRKDQGVDVCDEMNDGWMALVMRRKSFGHQASLSELAKKMFFMASTHLDTFREFIFTSSFLSTYEVDDATLEKIKNDDIELMRFSYKYLAASIFGTQDLTIKKEKVKAKIAELKEKQSDNMSKAEETYNELKNERDRMKEELEQKKKNPSK